MSTPAAVARTQQLQVTCRSRDLPSGLHTPAANTPVRAHLVCHQRRARFSNIHSHPVLQSWKIGSTVCDVCVCVVSWVFLHSLSLHSLLLDCMGHKSSRRKKQTHSIMTEDVVMKEFYSFGFFFLRMSDLISTFCPRSGDRSWSFKGFLTLSFRSASNQVDHMALNSPLGRFCVWF